MDIIGKELEARLPSILSGKSYFADSSARLQKADWLAERVVCPSQTQRAALAALVRCVARQEVWAITSAELLPKLLDAGSEQMEVQHEHEEY